MVSALALVPFLVAGQSTVGSINITIAGQHTNTLQNATLASDGVSRVPDCTSTIQADWTSQLTGTPCSAMQFWATSAADCEAMPDTNSIRFPDVSQGTFTSIGAHSGNFLFNLSDIFGAGSDAGVFACGATGEEATYLICADIQMSLSTICTTGSFSPVQTNYNTTLQTAAAIIYDTKPPGVPTITSDPADPQDSSLALSFSPGTGTDTTKDFYHFEFSLADSGVWQDTGKSPSASITTTTITGLDNGVTYQLRMNASDSAGNFSDYSNVVAGTPVASSGFWGAYRGDDGGAQGCAAAPGSIGAALLLLAGIRMLRRRA